MTLSAGLEPSASYPLPRLCSSVWHCLTSEWSQNLEPEAGAAAASLLPQALPRTRKRRLASLSCDPSLGRRCVLIATAARQRPPYLATQHRLSSPFPWSGVWAWLSRVSVHACPPGPIQAAFPPTLGARGCRQNSLLCSCRTEALGSSRRAASTSAPSVLPAVAGQHLSPLHTHLIKSGPPRIISLPVTQGQLIRDLITSSRPLRLGCVIADPE